MTVLELLLRVTQHYYEGLRAFPKVDVVVRRPDGTILEVQYVDRRDNLLEHRSTIFIDVA